MFCHLKMSIVWIWIVLISGEFIGFRGKKIKKCGKKFRKCRVLGQKHRTSWAQTSVLLMQNLRTLWQRSPMFSVFRPENAVKIPNIPLFLDFAIFGSKASRGGFRGHSQRVNDGVMKAELTVNGRWKKLHTRPFSVIPTPYFGGYKPAWVQDFGSGMAIVLFRESTASLII